MQRAHLQLDCAELESLRHCSSFRGAKGNLAILSVIKLKSSYLMDLVCFGHMRLIAYKCE